MPRATNSVARKKKHKKVLKQAKGYYGAASKLYRTAKQAVEKGLLYNYRDRRKRRIEFSKYIILLFGKSSTPHSTHLTSPSFLC